MSGAEGQPLRLLDAEGVYRDHPDLRADFDEAQIRGLYRDMAMVRRLDTECLALARQGELAVWTPLSGQEAAQVGSARSLLPGDMAFPTYRDHGVAWCRGVPPAALLAHFRGVAHSGWDPREYRLHPYSVVVGGHALHAVGYAMGAAAQGTADAAIAYLGDGAMSQGEVNEAFVWAAARRAPVVFVCQNNQWAISEPVERQSAVPLAERARGFGFPGVRVDGNDVLACRAVVRDALARARSGHGPTLVEAVTYRMGPHTSSDDPRRYRTAEEERVWLRRDPLARLRTHLSRTDTDPEKFLASVDEDCDALARELRHACRTLPDPRPGEIWEHVYAQTHPLVAEERGWYADYLDSFEETP
ncbi:pyruvate dehydrogenase (acetyl-transferring) E1 component subunit alpha [Nocardiopsis sp. FIRDI 009]|uniref:pyruvate dehydrogenase (acetyl-transferring) E1 component subunit alpha n=1 Tax=Nocardiopsis sp. FIRDI 009 TaxID=714197 RepID=UPI000E229BED|nr:pyruvate dehydrogenase (acetyl-transferring) E1 component subunit alpha [Nocardiopsis sp. FIRDI 009]